MPDVCAFDKGRSKDFRLLALCRRAAALQLGCRIRWRLRYVETGRNPSDKGSRLWDFKMADLGASAVVLEPPLTLTGLSMMLCRRRMGKLCMAVSRPQLLASLVCLTSVEQGVCSLKAAGSGLVEGLVILAIGLLMVRL